MLKEALDSYFQASCEDAMQTVAKTAAETAMQGNHSGVWREVIRSALNCKANANDIMNVAAELCGFADVSIINLADYVQLDPSDVFSFCFSYFEKNELFCKRLLGCLTNRSHETPAQQEVRIRPFELEVTRLPSLFSYCDEASQFICADFSQCALDMFRLCLPQFASHLTAFTYQFCAQLRHKLEDFGILRETAKLAAWQLLGDVEELSQLCINESELGSELGRFIEIFGCSPLSAFDIVADATLVFSHLAEINTSAAERCCRSLRIDGRAAVEASISRLTVSNYMSELSLFSVLGERCADARAYVGRLGRAELYDSGLVLHVFEEASAQCSASLLPWLELASDRRYNVDLYRSSCDVEVFGVRFRLSAALYIVFKALPNFEDASLTPEVTQAALSALIEYGLVVEAEGKYYESNEREVYEIYENERLSCEVLVEQNTTILPQALKAQICRKLKEGISTQKEIIAEFGETAGRCLKELEEDCVVEFLESGAWQLAE